MPTADTVFSTDIVDGEVKTATSPTTCVRSTEIGNGAGAQSGPRAPTPVGRIEDFDPRSAPQTSGSSSAQLGRVRDRCEPSTKVPRSPARRRDPLRLGILDNSLTLFTWARTPQRPRDFTNGAVTSSGSSAANNSSRARRSIPERLYQGHPSFDGGRSNGRYPELGLRRQRPLPRRRHLSARRRSWRRVLFSVNTPPGGSPLSGVRVIDDAHPREGLQPDRGCVPAAQQISRSRSSRSRSSCSSSPRCSSGPPWRLGVSKPPSPKEDTE